MKKQSEIYLTGRFEMENGSGVRVSVDYRNMLKEHRNEIEKATEDFLNSVEKILVEE